MTTLKSLIILLSLSMTLMSCGGGGGGKLDQTNPKSVVEYIFSSAKSGDFSGLSQLCDPKGENDGDTKRICNLANEEAKVKDSFKEYFAKGTVVGEAEVEGDKAAVKFKFGPDGSKDETMNLVQRDGKWYLSSF